MIISIGKLKQRTTVFVLLLVITLSTLLLFYSAQDSGADGAGFDFKSSILQVYYNKFPYALCSNDSTEPWESSNYLLGAPNMQYKDNLRNDTYYVTSWGNGGFTNQFMSYVNMIYLGTISDRIPVVSPFAPDHHISPNAGPLPFGEVFDLPQLRRTLRHPILEWSEVKAVASRLSMDLPAVVEELGCWSSRSPNEEHPIRATQLLRHLGLDVSYTRVPSHVRYAPQLDTNPHVSFFPLAETIFPVNPTDHPSDNSIMEASPLGARLGPDAHIACFDCLYFATAGTQEFEWKTPWSPVWRFIGRHLQFSESLMELSKAYVRRALKVTTDELPPLITVHARRGDFEHQCWDNPTDCLAPLSAFARRVQEVQTALFQKHGVNISEVLLTSDEENPSFWSEVTAQGWKYIDHVAERTLIQYGEWYPPVIDIVAQSLGAGFVGSIDSTVSIVSARRVEDWNHGVTRIVGWGGRE